MKKEINKHITLLFLIFGLCTGIVSFLSLFLGIFTNNFFLGIIASGIYLLATQKYLELSGVLK